MAATASLSPHRRYLPHPLSCHIIFFLLLTAPFRNVHGALIETPASKAVVAHFDTPDPESSFIHQTVNRETQTLYIGAVNYLYSLYPNLTRWQNVTTGPKPDNVECPPPMPQFQECSHVKKPMPSYNKALVVDYTNRRLIACWSLYHGFCEKRHLDDISKRDEPSYVPVVANNKNATTVAYIAPGPAPELTKPQPNVLYVSASWSRTGQNIWRERVPAFSSRNLDDFTLAYKDNFRQTNIKIEIQQLESFPVLYVYGFSSENFSYMITIQKRSANSEEYISKLFRVCQNDRNFYSYVEVELKCTHQGTHYNLVQAAFLGKSGKVLAQSLNIPTTEDVLYAVFSRGQDSSSNPTSEAALCVYPMRLVRRKFTENIQNCFDGQGNTGPDHIAKPLKCLRNVQTPITDDYCGSSDFNQPIGGSDPVASEAALKFPHNTNVSAIAVSITEEYTVAFVGTSSGRIYKMSLESESEANIYEVVSVQRGQTVRKDLLFDEDQEHLYVMTENRVSKMQVQNCSRYSTCSQCLGAGDPYCGWCALENKCSLKAECQGSDIPKRWLPYKGEECTKITSVRPSEIQKDKVRLLTLHIQNLPEFDKHYSYKCSFAPLRPSAASQPLLTNANRTNMGIQCYSPATHLLPPIPTGKDSIVMRLSVVMNQQEFVSTNFTFFDCNVHSSCTSCTNSQFPCTWCIRNHRCTHQTEEFCRTDVLITGKNQTGISMTPGPDNCPRIELANQETQILVPANTKRHITVHGIAMQEFQKDNLRCEFNIDTGKTVPATVTPHNTNGVLIECNTLTFDYYRNVSLYNVPFKIFWGPGSHPLDNPNGLQVVMYKCSSMAGNCGECFTVDPKYSCGWCDNVQCTTRSFCPGNWLPPSDICPNPTITQIHPYSGPLSGGTRLTITGENLGNDGKVEVDIDGVPCTVLEFTAPKRIVCQTEPALMQGQKGPVRVIVGRKHTGVSKTLFNYVEPEIMGISPTMGPLDGGTLLTIMGRYMDAGTSVNVTIGKDNGMPCLNVTSIGPTNLTCVTTSSSDPPGKDYLIFMNFDGESVQGPKHVTFTYTPNPTITGVTHKESIQSGGLQIGVHGNNLEYIQSPKMILWHNDEPYENTCQKSEDRSDLIVCLTPGVPISDDEMDPYISLPYGFRLDGVKALQNLTKVSIDDHGVFKIYPDPVFDKFEGGEKVHQQKSEQLVIEGTQLVSLRNNDVEVRVGKDLCTDVKVGKNLVTCKPPPTQPHPAQGSGLPEVTVTVGNQTYSVGFLRYEEPEVLSKTAIIAIAVAGGVVMVVLVILCILYRVKSRRNDDMMKKMRIQMDMLEARVANECKEAFAELQTDMTELTSDTYGQVTIPFWDYRTYCMRIMFPGVEEHSVVKELQLDYHRRESIERGLRQFSSLISNKTFILIFVRTLEANKTFNLRDRVNVASLLSVALQTQMEYSTEILKTLLAELIEKTVESKNTPKLLLRRNESVAEKMLTNWFTFLLYKFLKECAGEPLFMLFQAIKQQTSKGPVDAVTGEARYSLSEDKLIRQQIQYKAMTLYVLDVDVDRCAQPAHPVKVLDCDAISQVKEKILDAIYKNAPFSSRPPKDELDLVLFDHPPEWICADKSQIPPKMFPNRDTKRLVLQDEDSTSKVEGDCRRINTLAHYQVPDGAYVALHPKQLLQPYNISITSEKTNYAFYNRSPSLTRTVTPHVITVDVDNNGIKHYHLVRQHDIEPSKEGDRGSKMVSEIYLPRLLVTKGTLQQFVDDLFERIFSTAHRGSALPLAIKYMFDFLDDQALLHNIQDPEVVHTWKSNSLPLRFWVNVIKNPDFAFDVHKTSIVDSCLTVVGQTFMDACSQSEHRLGKDSPSSKLLYAKDIPKYKQWVERYYQDIKMMPAISDQDMTAMLTEESRVHHSEFNANAALMELYKYAQKYSDELMTALEEDEFARKSKLNYKLDQVIAAMDGNTIC